MLKHETYLFIVLFFVFIVFVFVIVGINRWYIKKNAKETIEDENKRLRAENKLLKQERDILKKAAAYFAKD